MGVWLRGARSAHMWNLGEATRHLQPDASNRKEKGAPHSTCNLPGSPRHQPRRRRRRTRPAPNATGASNAYKGCQTIVWAGIVERAVDLEAQRPLRVRVGSNSRVPIGCLEKPGLPVASGLTVNHAGEPGLPRMSHPHPLVDVQLGPHIFNSGQFL